MEFELRKISDKLRELRKLGIYDEKAKKTKSDEDSEVYLLRTKKKGEEGFEELFSLSAKEKKELSEMILPLSFQLQSSVVVGVAGTVTTLKAVELQMENYDHSFIHGKELTLNSIIKLGKLFLSMSNLKRAKLKGLPSERSDIIPMGVIILEAILRKINRQSIIISDHGLRWGLIYRWIDENL